MKYRLLTVTAGLALLPGLAAAKAPSNEELYAIIQKQQQQIEQLMAQVRTSQKTAESAEQKIAATAERVEQVAATPVPAASSASSWADRTHVGGYGELHYNNLDGSGGASDKDEVDFHRFVLYFGHQFNERTRFVSELEVEHAFIEDESECEFEVPAGGFAGGEEVECEGSGSPGEVELEQAYLEFDLNDSLSAKGGVFLVPVGIMNETHEPPTFYGVERNPVENNIIPSTWWEAGGALSGHFGEGFSVDGALHSGLETGAGDKYAVRAGRQKAAKANAEDLAGTARLKWTGMPGLELAASLQYQGDITQGNDSTAGSALLYELHAAWQKDRFGLRALYAAWDLDGSGPESVGADEQKGFYIEPSFKVHEQVGLFARYNQWDNQAGDGNATESEKTQWDLGVNYWPHEDVVVKADYQMQDNDNDKDQDGFNLGIGYQF